MADFTVAFTSGVTSAVWSDPATASKPDRTNTAANLPHRRRVGTTGTPITVTASVDGVAGEVDSNLGGELFTATPVEWPFTTIPVFTGAAGQSSVQTFTPTAAGHYTIVLARPNHGRVFMHLDVVDP